MGTIGLFALLLAGTAASGAAQELSARPADACRDYAAVAYNCCVYVRGYRDEPHCRATHLTRAQDRARSAVQSVVKEIVKQVGTGGTALARMSAASLIPQLVTDRLDLTGQDGLASAMTARCAAGESVAPYSNSQRRGTRSYSNPEYWAGRRENQEQVAAHVTELRDACRAQTVERGLAEARRPRGELQWCGRMITERPPQQLTGYQPPAGSYVRPVHYCSPRTPNCCQRGYVISTSNAYCERDPLPNDGYSRVCARSVAP